MGYYVTLDDADFILPAENEAEALERLKLLNAPEMDFAKSGGSFGGGQKEKHWYSWMPEDYDKTVKTVADVFDHLGFETTVDEGNTRLTAYDSKTGQEDLFLFVIRDLVKPGSYLRWTGEDGSKFEYSFRDGQMFYREGGWSVSDPTPLRARIHSYGTGHIYVDLVPEDRPVDDNEREATAAAGVSAFGYTLPATT